MRVAYGSLAQLVEQVTFNHLVGGSSPSWPTGFRNRLRNEAVFCFYLMGLQLAANNQCGN